MAIVTLVLRPNDGPQLPVRTIAAFFGPIDSIAEGQSMPALIPTTSTIPDEGMIVCCWGVLVSGEAFGSCLGVHENGAWRLVQHNRRVRAVSYWKPLNQAIPADIELTSSCSEGGAVRLAAVNDGPGAPSDCR